MKRPLSPLACLPLVCLLLAGAVESRLEAQGPPPPPAAADLAPPKDLRPLLQPRQSELRLVAARYALDRGTLSGNYQGGTQPGFGRGGAEPPPSLSANRIARLKRFDLDWQSAVSRLDAARLSPAARSDLDALKTSIGKNLEGLEAETRSLAELTPLLPFAPAIARIVEARIRMEDPDARRLALGKHKLTPATPVEWRFYN